MIRQLGSRQGASSGRPGRIILGSFCIARVTVLGCGISDNGIRTRGFLIGDSGGGAVDAEKAFFFMLALTRSSICFFLPN